MRPIIKDDFFDPLLLAAVKNAIDAGGFHYGWKSNIHFGFGHWNMPLAGFALKNRADVTLQLPPLFRTLWHAINVESNYVPIRAYVNQYTYGTGGYPHKDSDVPSDMTFMLYLNPTWKREWAGGTVFFEGEEASQIIMPRFNRLIAFQAAQFHAGLEVSRICPEARQVLVFKARRKENDDA